jgi:protein required for attachment to host cells
MDDLHSRLIDESNSDQRAQEIQDLALKFATGINRVVPDGRLKSLAITAIEQALLWTEKALRATR